MKVAGTRRADHRLTSSGTVAAGPIESLSLQSYTFQSRRVFAVGTGERYIYLFIIIQYNVPLFERDELGAGIGNCQTTEPLRRWVGALKCVCKCVTINVFIIYITWEVFIPWKSSDPTCDQMSGNRIKIRNGRYLCYKSSIMSRATRRDVYRFRYIG